MIACKKEDPAPAKSTEKAITIFSFASLNPVVTGSISGTSISATVPFGTNLSLTPTISVSTKATVSPSSGSSQDFSKSVAYTVTAEDGSTQTYNITVSLGKSPEKDILTFAFNGLTPAVNCVIDATAKMISATLPAGTDATKLVPTLINSPKATVSPATGVAQDFTKAVTYTVTAEDGTTKSYSTNITIEKPVDGGTVYIGNFGGTFYAIDALSGIKKWEFKAGGEIQSSATVANGIVYFGCNDKKLYALDAATGAKKWEFLTNATFKTSVPMYVNGVIYVGSGHVFAIDALKGTKIWEMQVDTFYDYDVECSVTVVDGILYGSVRGGAGTYLGLFALDATTGTRKWSKTTGTPVTESSPAVYNGLVYAGSELDGIQAFDISTGMVKLKDITPSGLSSGFSRSSPTIVNGIAYIGAIFSGKFYAIDATTGKIRWEFLAPKGVDSSPIVSNGIVYFGCNDGKLYALDATTGNKKWEFLTTSFNYIESSPTVANGLVYVGSEDKKIYALDMTTGVKKWEFLSNERFFGSSPSVVDKDGKVFYPSISGMVQ